MTGPDFRDAFQAHKEVVYRFAYRMTGSPAAAEDVVQDCFGALWKNPDSYDSRRGALRAYLLGIARKLILKRWRRERFHESIEEESFVSLPVDFVAIERAQAVAAAVGMLPPLQREAVVLAEYEEMPLEEIAGVTGADLAAVKSRLHRARQNLRKMLAPYLEGRGAYYGTEKRS
jgi:RNA polymerase sigma-70 factor, ECF subfamily